MKLNIFLVFCVTFACVAFAQAAVTPPSITTQPVDTTVTLGQAAKFTVTATGTKPLSYQWKKNGVNITGATNPSYTTPPTTLADNGSHFAVTVTNSAGSVTSNNATLTVNPAPTPTPTVTPTPSPTPTPPPAETYGNDADGSVLQWVRYTPQGAGPWPAVILIHGGYFQYGGPGLCAQAGSDLSAAGFLCFAITYRLDVGLILGQPAIFNGRRTGVAGPTSDIHDQSDDVRTAIRAARADPDCNGKVYGVGGSAGGCHVLFAAVTGTLGDDKPDAAVGLS